MQECLLLQGGECCSFCQKSFFWLHKECLLLIHIGSLFVTCNVLDSESTFSNVTFNANTFPIFFGLKKTQCLLYGSYLECSYKVYFSLWQFCFIYILFSWVWSFKILRQSFWLTCSFIWLQKLHGFQSWDDKIGIGLPSQVCSIVVQNVSTNWSNFPS